MELTINIKEHQKIPFFLEHHQEFDYVEILNISEEESTFPKEHQKILEERLKKIESGETTFRSWDVIKQKYERKII